jgi:uncharacterized protein YyaL (SSP411 family)
VEWIKSHIELLQKALLYFQSNDTYFKRSDTGLIMPELSQICIDYPIDFAHLLEGIHFRNFDKNRVPIQRIGRNWIYSNSMITAYGLANVQLYLRTGKNELIDLARIQAEYLFENALKSRGQVLLLEYETTTKKHTGDASAMNQGQASSLFLRMYQLLDDERWLDRARDLYHSFYISWDQKGGISYFFEDGSVWLEEYPRPPLKHTLNGALFGVIALQEISEIIEELRPLRDRVFRGLEKMLPQFDRGYWSNYHVHASNNRTYIASMKYHALHALQLRIIGEQGEVTEFTKAADLYDHYQASRLNRFRAVLQMIKEKTLRQYK